MTFTRRCTAALLALLFAVQLALPACAPAARPGFGFGFPAKHSQIVTVPPVLSFVTYDTSIGNGVDATTGTANLPLRAGANRYYVNSSTGSDANTCTQAKSASTPKATMASGYTCLVDGNGDQMLVAQGTSYSEVLPPLNINGFSATYPVVIQSYDPADPTNEAKYGRATTNRPVVNTGSTATQYITCCMTRPVKYLAVRDFKWGWGNNADQHINVLGSNGLSNSYALFENNVVPYAMLDIEQDLREASPHIVVRGNTIYGAWSSTNHAQAIYAEAVSGLVIEDNFFWHNGWITTAANRDIGDASGGPTIFNHEVYMQDSSNGLIRRNLFMDASAAACSCRGMVAENDNVAIDNPVSLIAGLGNNYNLVRPNGEYEFEIGNVVFGDADINTANPAGDGLKNGNGKVGSRTSYNLLARSRNPSGVNVAGFDTNAGVATPISNMDFHDNVEYSWAAAGQVKKLTDTTGNGTGGFNVTYENNAWSDPASGSNVNIASHTTPNPYTSSTLYTALGLGCTTKSACITAWLDHPELHPARTIRTVLRAGFNVSTPVAEDLALSNNSFILTAPYTSVILGALDGSTTTVSGNPSCITEDGPNRTVTYDGGCSASSGSFNLVETPLVGSPHTTTISYSIAAQPTLGTITLSSALVSGTSSSGTFVGGYGGIGVGSGFLQLGGTLPGGFSSGPACCGSDGQGIASHQWHYDGTAFTSGSFTITEYVNGATNSPHTSTISYAATPASGWNPADVASGVTLSGTNNVTATFFNQAWNDVRGTQSHATGKYYFEGLVASGTLSTNGIGIGVATSAHNLINSLNSGSGTATGYYSSGYSRGSDFGGSNLAAYAVGDVIGVAVDVDNHLIWWSKNNSWQNGNPATGTGGYVAPTGTVFPIGGGWDSVASFTLRTGSAAQSYSAPSGFSPWG